MPKTPIKLNGATMGTRWQLAHDGEPVPGLHAALAAAVEEVDAQMSLWRDSDLVRLNAAAPGVWLDLPEALAQVIEAGLGIGRASGGAFDIGLGDAVAAWGFGPSAASEAAIQAARRPRPPAHELVELDGRRLRKHGPVTLDLNGIAKGYGVDRLVEIARAHGVTSALAAIDGELRAIGPRAWPVAVEAPLVGHRAAHSHLALQEAAVASSGTYRHFVTVAGRRLSHLIDRRTGLPLMDPPEQVTVLARDCMSADAWAKVFMVLTPAEGIRLAALNGVSVLVLGPAPYATGAFAAEAA